MTISREVQIFNTTIDAWRKISSSNKGSKINYCNRFHLQ
jgi:hypothetical protein